MGRPSKFGEKTTAIRVPASKLAAIQQIVEGTDPNFVQNPDLGQLLSGILATCQGQGISPHDLLLYWLYRDLISKLDRMPPPMQQQFCAWLVERYLGGNNG